MFILYPGFLQGHMLNKTVEGINNATLDSTGSLLDNPRLEFYRVVYGSAILGVMGFTALKSVVYVKVGCKSSCIYISSPDFLV